MENRMTKVKLTLINYLALTLIINILFTNAVICGIFGEKSTKLKGALNENEGIVLVQFVNNSRVQAGLSNWDEVILENIKTKKTFKLLPIHNNGFIASIIFSGVLKEGKYKLTKINEMSDYTGAVVSTRFTSIPITSNLGVFSISKKSITDLGTVILYPIYVQSDNGNIERNLISINTNEKNHLVSILKELNKDVYDSINKQPINGWDEDKSDENEILLQKIYLHGTPFKFQYLKKTNTLIIYHKLGGITFITDGKPPFDIHTGYYSNFMSYIQVENGHILAGENGLILFSSNLTGPWKNNDILETAHTVVDLYYENKNLIAITNYNENPCPKHLSCTGTNKLSLNLDKKTYSIISRNHKDINYPNAFDNYHLAPYENYVFGQKLDYKLNNGILVKNVYGLITSNNNNKRKRISFDNGKSWKNIKTYLNPAQLLNGYNSDRPIYVNKDKMVYVIASPPHKPKKRDRYKKRSQKKEKKPSSKKRYISLFKMPIDDIDTQNPKYVISKIDPSCSRLITDISSDNVLYISCINGNVIKTTDDGKTWKIVYENQ